MLNISDHQGNENQNHNKMNEMIHTTTWVNLENMLCEIARHKRTNSVI